MRSAPLFLSAVIAAVTICGSFAAQAQSQSENRNRVRAYCADHPGDRDCRAHRRGDDSTVGSILRKTGNVIAGAGRVVGSALGAGACEARYKSYDPRTNTYRGSDGRRHTC